MKTFLKISVAIFSSLIVLLLCLFAWLGGFSEVTVTERTSGPFTVVYYELNEADMAKVGAATTAMDHRLHTLGLSGYRPFDIYYADHHCEIGFAVDSTDKQRILAADSTIRSTFIPSQNFITTTFPWKSRLSYLIAYMKVDPALARYRGDHGLRRTWAATMHSDDLITYLQPAERE